MKLTRLVIALGILVFSAILAGPTPVLSQGPGPEVDPVSYVVGNDADTGGLDCVTPENRTPS